MFQASNCSFNVLQIHPLLKSRLPLMAKKLPAWFFSSCTKKNMKKTLIFIAVLLGVVNYLLNRKKTPVNTDNAPRTRHLTNAFSKAKQRAVNT
jgi:hypothetical protein